VVERAERFDRRRVVRTGLHGQAALAGGGDHLGQRHRDGMLGDDAEPEQAGGREDHRLGLAGGELAQARVDVPTQILHRDVGTPSEHLCLSPNAGGSDARPGPEVALPGHQHIERGCALGNGRDHDALVVGGGKVLGGMHGEVHLAVEQGAHDLGDEQSLQAGGIGRRIDAAITRGGDRHELGLDAAPAEFPGDLVRLSECEPRAAGPDPERHSSSGASSNPKSSASVRACAS
jgi:hypothetical protein